MTTNFRATHDVIIRTEAWDEAARFYRSVLGLPVTQESEGFIGFDAGAFQLYVERGPAHGPILEFLAPDMQAAKDRLLAAGCTVYEDDPAVPHFYMRDPYGMVFNLREASDPA